MKITPVKNYKKPRYAALAMAAATMLAGCNETEVALDGDVAMPFASDSEETGTITTVAPTGTVVVTTEETTTTEFEISTTTTPAPSLTGTIVTTEESEVTTTKRTTTKKTTIVTPVPVTSLQGTVTTVDDETDISADEIADDNIVEVSTEGVVVAPEDTLCSTEEDEPFELAGDVAVEDEGEEDEYLEFMEEGDVVVADDDVEHCTDIPVAEEFSLAGDIAVVPDYEANNEGMEYAERYIESFNKYGISITEKAGDEWGPFAAVYEEKPFIISFESISHNLYISFFNSEDRAFCSELEYYGATKFDYGYFSSANINDKLYAMLYIDVSTDHYKNTDLIAEITLDMDIPGSNPEEKSVWSAYNKGVNSSIHNVIISKFKERDCQLTAYTKGDNIIEYIGFESYAGVPLVLDSNTHKVFMMYYDSTNSYDPITKGLKENKAPKTSYGAVLADVYGYTYIFIDVSKITDNNLEEISSAIALEELETL